MILYSYLGLHTTAAGYRIDIVFILRVAHYSSWIQKTMAYLDSDYVSLEADIVENDEDQVKTQPRHNSLAPQST